MSGTAPDDHRTRVGHKRRERMRARLIGAACQVFAERGPEAAQIDHVIRHASVSRGTFYNCFRSTDDLLEVARDALATDMVALVSAAANPADPAVLRLTDGIKAFIDLAQRHPLLLDFIARFGLRYVAGEGLLPALPASAFRDVIADDVAGHWAPRVARDNLKGATLTLLWRLMRGETVDVAGFVAAMLRVFGQPAEAAARLTGHPVAPLVVPDASLIARSEAARRVGLRPPA